MEKHIKRIKEFCKKEKVNIKEFKLRADKNSTKLLYLKSVQNKKTLVFVHGLGCNRYYPFVELFLKLLEEGYSIITFDLPEHGENKNVFSIKASSKTLSKVISFSKKKLGIQKKELVLIGQSLGGFLSLLESEQNSVAGIITISAFYKINPYFFLFLEGFSLITPNFLKQLNYYSFKEVFLFGIFKKKSYPIRINFLNKLEKMEKEMVSYNLLNKIRNSKVPLLQMHGKLDLFVPFPQAKEIKENYGGSDKKQFFPFFSNHFSILFKKRVIEEISTWLGQEFKN